jgi:hypothetical protein
MSFQNEKKKKSKREKTCRATYPFGDDIAHGLHAAGAKNTAAAFLELGEIGQAARGMGANTLIRMSRKARDCKNRVFNF